MSLYKRKGSNLYWVGFTVNGRRIQKSTGTDDRDKAQEFHDKLKAQLWDQDKLGARPDPLWEEVVLRWIREKEDQKKTLQDDIIRLRFLNDYLAGRHLSEIDSDLIQFIRQEVRNKPHGRVKDNTWKASPKTVNNYMGVIQSILNFAYANDWLVRVPTIPMYKVTKRLRWLTPEQVQMIMRHLPQYMRDMAMLALSTGLRRHNVISLKWSQVDLKKRVAWFDADEMKNGEHFMIPLNEDAIAIIRRQLGQHHEYVFVNSQGRPVEHFHHRVWKRAVDKAGIEDFRWHDLRHTWASWHVQAGTNPLELQELGGWKKLDMVKRYAHLSPGKLQEAASRIVTVSLHPALEVVKNQ